MYDKDLSTYSQTMSSLTYFEFYVAEAQPVLSGLQGIETDARLTPVHH
jgi:hypothetical protein